MTTTGRIGAIGSRVGRAIVGGFFPPGAAQSLETAHAALAFVGYKSGLASGRAAVGPLTICNSTTPVDAVGVQTLASGNNSIIVPAGAIAALIVPPVMNTVTLTLKGLPGDTGVVLSLTNPTVLSLASAQTAFTLNASAGVMVIIQWV